jgi:murein DD-endopeptidase MepM/ murein hydrolase activator NlpD
VINHQNGYQTVYAHLSSISVSRGQTVEKGSAIGVRGATDDATSVHLHFEVYKNGALQDPLNYSSQ